MDFLPKELEDIIIDYKEHFEYQENLKQHNKKFRKSLTIIKKLRNTAYNNHNYNNQETTVTIGPLIHPIVHYTYCFCFRVCNLCHDIIASSRMYENDIGNKCKC